MFSNRKKKTPPANSQGCISTIDSPNQRLNPHIPIWLIFDSGVRVDVNKNSLPHSNHNSLSLSAKIRGQKKIEKWQQANPDKRLSEMPAIVYQQKDFKLFGLF